MIDTKHLVKSAEDFARSIGGYLDTQLDYIDNLRNRPKFFFGTTHVNKKLNVVKIPVPIIKVEDQEFYKCLPRMRRKPKVPVPVPSKVRERELEEDVKEPVAEPVREPVKEPQKTGELDVEKANKVLEELARSLDIPEEELTPEVPQIVPAKPVTPAVPQPEKEAQPVRATPASYQSIITQGIARALEQDRSQSIPTPDGGRIFIDRRGRVLSVKTGDMVRAGEEQSKFWSSVFFLTNAPAIVRGGSRAVPGRVMSSTPALTRVAGGTKGGGGPRGPGAGIAGLVQAANNIVRFARSAQPALARAHGGKHNAPTYVLTGEKARELIFPQNKMGEVANAMYREVGSIMVGTSYSMAVALPRDSATYSEIGKLKSKFGMDRSFDPAIPGFPEQIGVFDSVKPEMPTAESGGFFGMLASGAKTIASAISRAVIPAAQASPPSPDDPVIIPDTDPSVAGMGVRPTGITNSKNVSGYPVTSAMGMRWHPILGDWRMHGGYDISVPQGKLVAINKPGEIVFAGAPAGLKGGYGNVIDAWVPSLKLQFRLAHLSAFVKTSGSFKAGEALGRIGSTGLSTGPHLHFETDRQKGSTRYGGDMDKQQTGNATKHLIIGDAVDPAQTAQGPDDPSFIGPRLPEGGWGLKPDGTHGNSNVGDTNRGHDGTLYKLVPKPGYGYNMWVPVKKAQIFDDNLVAQEKSMDLSVTRVNSIVPIPIQGPPQYTTKVVPIMRKRRTKPTFVISPLSKGVEYV